MGKIIVLGLVAAAALSACAVSDNSNPPARLSTTRLTVKPLNERCGLNPRTIMAADYFYSLGVSDTLVDEASQCADASFNANLKTINPKGEAALVFKGCLNRKQHNDDKVINPVMQAFIKVFDAPLEKAGAAWDSCLARSIDDASKGHPYAGVFSAFFNLRDNSPLGGKAVIAIDDNGVVSGIINSGTVNDPDKLSYMELIGSINGNGEFFGGYRFSNGRTYFLNGLMLPKNGNALDGDVFVGPDVGKIRVIANKK